MWVNSGLVPGSPGKLCNEGKACGADLMFFRFYGISAFKSGWVQVSVV